MLPISGIVAWKKGKEQNNMGNLVFICLLALMVLSLSACGNGGQGKAEDTLDGSQQTVSISELKDTSMADTEENKANATETVTSAEADGSNILIAYFSDNGNGRR